MQSKYPSCYTIAPAHVCPFTYISTVPSLLSSSLIFIMCIFPLLRQRKPYVLFIFSYTCIPVEILSIFQISTDSMVYGNLQYSFLCFPQVFSVEKLNQYSLTMLLKAIVPEC